MTRKPAPKVARKLDVAAPTTKCCASCGKDRPVAKFLPSRFVADGFIDTCKTCTYANADSDRRQRETRKRPAGGVAVAATESPLRRKAW